MKKFIFLLVGAVIVLLLFGVFSRLVDLPTSAQKSNVGRWEYCAITGSYVPSGAENQATIAGAVNICYLQTAGCQNEEVKTDLIYNKFLQDWRLENTGVSKTLAFNRAQETAFAKAVAKLGAEGWEMVSTPTFEFDNYFQNYQGTYTVYQGNKEVKPDVYFKRLKTP